MNLSSGICICTRYILKKKYYCVCQCRVKPCSSWPKIFILRQKKFPYDMSSPRWIRLCVHASLCWSFKSRWWRTCIYMCMYMYLLHDAGHGLPAGYLDVLTAVHHALIALQRSTQQMRINTYRDVRRVSVLFTTDGRVQDEHAAGAVNAAAQANTRTLHSSYEIWRLLRVLLSAACCQHFCSKMANVVTVNTRYIYMYRWGENTKTNTKL